MGKYDRTKISGMIFFARFITLRQHRPQKSGFKGDALHLMVRPALSFRSGGFSGLLHRGHPYCNKQHPKP